MYKADFRVFLFSMGDKVEHAARNVKESDKGERDDEQLPQRPFTVLFAALALATIEPVVPRHGRL